MYHALLIDVDLVLRFTYVGVQMRSGWVGKLARKYIPMMI